MSEKHFIGNLVALLFDCLKTMQYKTYINLNDPSHARHFTIQNKNSEVFKNRRLYLGQLIKQIVKLFRKKTPYKS